MISYGTTEQARQVINLLQNYRVLKYGQVRKYFSIRNNIRPERVDPILNNIRGSGLLRYCSKDKVTDDTLVYLTNSAKPVPDHQLIKAFDVLLLFSGVKFHYVSDYPFQMFFISRNDIEYHVMSVQEEDALMLPVVLSSRPDVTNIIGVFDDYKQMERFEHPKLCLAYAPDISTGEHKLYTLKEPVKNE